MHPIILDNDLIMSLLTSRIRYLPH